MGASSYVFYPGSDTTVVLLRRCAILIPIDNAMMPAYMHLIIRFYDVVAVSDMFIAL